MDEPPDHGDHSSSASSKTAALAVLKPLFLLLGALGWALLRLTGTRAGLLRYDRIGHLAGNTEIFLRRRAAGKNGGKIMLFSGPPANRQLLDMIARRLPVVAMRPALWVYTHGLLPLIKGAPCHEPLANASNDYEAYAMAGPQLSFSSVEAERGAALLRRMGVPSDARYVCVHARDSAYLDRALGHKSREDWSYQDHRDCAIETYLPAMETLAQKGRFSLRMGSVVNAPLIARNPKIIDYATRFRSDFGDIYLSARCRFFLGSEGGLFSVAAIFNVPAALANLIPIGYAPVGKEDLFILKTFREAKTGRPVPFRELVRMGGDRWQRLEQFRSAGLDVVNNTAAEIAALAEEMDARLDGVWTPLPGDEELQALFRAVFPKGHPIEGYPSRVGADYLRRHKELLS